MNQEIIKEITNELMGLLIYEDNDEQEKPEPYFGCINLGQSSCCYIKDYDDKLTLLKPGMQYYTKIHQYHIDLEVVDRGLYGITLKIAGIKE